MTDNVLSFPINRVEKAKAPVPDVCATAAENFEEIIILGQNKDGGAADDHHGSRSGGNLLVLEAARLASCWGV